jgi:hypothetical protein
LPNGQTVSYQPLRSAAPGPIPFDLAFNNMDYNGGPVMPSNTDYMLMWSPQGLGAYPDGFVSGISRYFSMKDSGVSRGPGEETSRRSESVWVGGAWG